jgi:hypothetical protein
MWLRAAGCRAGERGRERDRAERAKGGRGEVRSGERARERIMTSKKREGLRRIGKTNVVCQIKIGRKKHLNSGCAASTIV